jgi:hypothetical protein
MSGPEQAPEKPSNTHRSSSGGIVVSRRTLIISGVVVLVLLLGSALAVGFAFGGTGANAPREESPVSSTAPSRSPSAPPAQTATPQTQAPEPVAQTFRLGDTIETGDITLTVNSMEVVDSVATTDGVPITPDAGGQLVVLKMIYSNSKLQADLSCGSTDLYLQAFDTLEREMAPVFELYRVPGNPACNDYLLQDTPHEWTYIFQSVAGATPLALSVTAGQDYANPTWIDLQP